jgi:hypothetical protein
MTSELDMMVVCDDGQLALTVAREQSSLLPLVSPAVGDSRLIGTAVSSDVPTIFEGQGSLDV